MTKPTHQQNAGSAARPGVRSGVWILAKWAANQTPLAPRLALAALMSMAAAQMLVACASTPPPPDWRLNAHGALERAVAADLSGDTRVAGLEFDRARAEIARTGRIDLMARAELLRCAAQLAGLQFDPCAGFEPLRGDAAAAEVAYADFMLGKLDAARISLLPAPQQRVAAAGSGAASDLATLQGIADPLSRLVAAAVWLQAGRASPAIIMAAVDTASAQGWRRPLLAWLKLQQRRAELAGDSLETERLGRRIRLVLDGAGSVKPGQVPTPPPR